MNVLFLLLIAVALLLMSHRYWGRMLGALVFAPLQPSAGEAATRGSSLDAGALHIAASGGVLSVVGVGLALTWGWAPVFVWILVGCALVSGLLRSALDWMAAVTGEARPLDAVGRVGGGGLAGAMRVALTGALLVWTPVMLVMLASLVTRHPAAAAALSVQCLLALALRRWMGGVVGAAGVGVILLAGIAAVPAGMALPHFAQPALPVPMAPGMAAPSAAAVLLVLAVFIAPRRRERFLAPLSVMVSVALAIVMLLAVAAVVIEYPASGYLGYFRAEGGPGALPLVAAVACVGVLPLLVMLGRHAPAAPGFAPATGSTFEGLLAVIVLAALLAAPSLMDGASIDLPDWRLGIEAPATLEYAVAALAALLARLPVPPSMLVDAVASVFAGALAVLLVVACDALAHLAARLAPGGPARARTCAAAMFAMLAAITALFFWRAAIPVTAWLLCGQLSLLFAAALMGAATFAAMRMRRGAWLCAALALLLGVLFWWTCLQQGARALAAGNWPALALQALIALLGGYAALMAAANFARLSALRRTP